MLFPLIEENDDLTVFMTESCNSNCVMCPMSRDSRKRGNHCSDEAWAEALAVLHKRRYRHISITGGEPFLMAERLLSLMHAAGYTGRYARSAADKRPSALPAADSSTAQRAS